MKPITFSDRMVRAILDRSKTATRRPVKPGKKVYQVGEILWVRETHAIETNRGYDTDANPPYNDARPVSWIEVNCVIGDVESGIFWEQAHYKATDPTPELTYENSPRKGCKGCENNDPHVHWVPPMFMPRWASRISLKVLSVSKQELLDITDEDAQKEGFENRQEFLDYWDSLYKKKPEMLSKNNPDVWVVEFEVVE